ncbi:TonB-dependent receptor [Olivibacter sitiensis]|uniref:TonB-dependent receptor n=1 Tax=Olivibacter sitiensis TaxID=376470 RepID=UPI00146FA836|nr:TonB-dependent receptor [Olivibacter sitiensis]
MNFLKQFLCALIFTSLTFGFSNVVKAQQTGVKGVVIDVETLKPMEGVTLQILSSSYGARTDAKGEFFIALPKDKDKEYVMVASMVGYDTDSTTFKVFANDVEVVSLALLSKSSVLDEVVITTRRERASEIALLDIRRQSNLTVELIGAQELSRKGVRDAEGALTKMSGVTKSGAGANVFVRGLGDRYNSTTLNGLALPSEDPLNKNISLDFFGTSVIDNIAVNKTFNPVLLGDVAGANIDIVSKELSGRDFFEIGAASGINSQAISADDFKKIDGTNWFGTLRERKSPITTLSQYDFGNSWNTSQINTPINSSFSLSGGKRFYLPNGTLNLFITGNMDSEYRYFDGVIRQTSTNGALILDQEMERSQYNVSKTAMANLKYVFGNHYVAFNSMYIGDQGQDYSQNYGINTPEEDGDLRLWRRQHVVDNHLLVNQLLSKLDLTNNWKLDLGVGYNYVNANEPDRRTTNLLVRNGSYRFYNNAGGADNERYYSEISERGWALKAIATYRFDNAQDLDRKIEFGYNGNLITRDFDVRMFYHNVLGDPTVSNGIDDISSSFNNSTLQANYFRLETNWGATSLDPNWYSARKDIHSALAVGTYQFSEKFTGIVGVRYDKIDQEIDYRIQLRSSAVDPSIIDKSYILPSLNLKYELNEQSNLRASASMSYTLPQFIELAPFQNTFATFRSEGNPNLVPVENTNFDLKWEWFPSNGELISAGVFYKNMKNPIARVESINNLMNYINIGSTAEVAGAEIEMKKNLLKKATNNGENVLSAGANVSYLYSDQELKTAAVQFGEKTNSALQGASPLLANADLSYLYNGRNWNVTSSVVANYFSDRIFLIGTGLFKNVIEKGVPTLDFVGNASIANKWGINLRVRNMLNPNINLERETDSNENIVLESYKRGIDASLGVSYRF